MFKSSFVCCACLCAALSVDSIAAQEAPSAAGVPFKIGAGGNASDDKSTLGGGVLNGKAISLVKPPYPPAAKAVRASGAVNVRVLVDENGDVISAEAISGHALLRAASVQAARASKFTPTRLSGQPVKVSGVIVYNFVAEMNLEQLGFALGFAEHAAEIDERFPAVNLTSSISPDWSEALRHSSRLVNRINQDRWRRASEAAAKAENESSTDKNPATNGESEVASSRPIKIGVVVVAASKPPAEVINESPAQLAAILIESLKQQLAADPNRVWSFSLGLTLGKIEAQFADDAKLRLNLGELRQAAADAPRNIRPEQLNLIKDLAAIADKNDIADADKAKIRDFLKRFR